MKETDTLPLKIYSSHHRNQDAINNVIDIHLHESNKTSQVKCVTKPLIHLRRKSVAHSCLTFGCSSAHGSHVTFHGFKSDWKWAPQATWMWPFIAAALLWERESHFWTLAALSDWPIWSFVCIAPNSDNYNIGESHWQRKCQINVLPQYITCCNGEFDKPDKKVKCFTSLFFNSFSSCCVPFLISIVFLMHQQFTLFKSDSVLNWNCS